MSKYGSKVIWIAGGSAAFVAAFLGVALARGAPLKEVPPFRWFASSAPAGGPEAATGARTGAASSASHAPSTPSDANTAPHASPRVPSIPPMTAGVLGAFVMPSPYDARELHELDQQLKNALARVGAEGERLARRERELDDWQQALQQRAQELAALRTSLDDPGAPGATSAAERNSSGKDASAKSGASWRALAPLFAEGEASDVAERLGQLDPDEAAQVLRGLESDRCAEILNALPKERYKAFLDAWRRAGG